MISDIPRAVAISQAQLMLAVLSQRKRCRSIECPLLNLEWGKRAGLVRDVKKGPNTNQGPKGTEITRYTDSRKISRETRADPQGRAGLKRNPKSSPPGWHPPARLEDRRGKKIIRIKRFRAIISLSQ